MMAKPKDSDESRKQLKERLRQASLKPHEIHIPDQNAILERDRRYLENLLGRVDEKVEDEWERQKIRAEIIKNYSEGTRLALDHVYREYEDEVWFKKDWEPLK